LADMLVRSYVTLNVPADERHLKMAREAAGELTTDRSAVTVEVQQGNPKVVVTTFPMKRARQIDVGDRIMHAFAMNMEDYSGQCIGFPKTDAEIRRDHRKLERAKERRRERRAAREAEVAADRTWDIPRGLAHASREVEANRIYELVHEFALPRDLFEHGGEFYRGDGSELELAFGKFKNHLS